ncbi:BTAD domain-containing putative transcriptional regulator [Paenarthrobacter sp. NPDC089322]|uniref:AfsR/SARP family transcriptional regulator n=1 Tax=Paenarthrobacter sp. NPDC089322 TaxID=3155065 RepID=UPI0034262C8C
MNPLQLRVLGPIRIEVGGTEVLLSKRRHREIIAILTLHRGRAIPTTEMIDMLWEDAPPPGAVGAVRTFIGELRKILEPHRPPRTPPTTLVTIGDGYALRLEPEAVDVWRFETALNATAPETPSHADARLTKALGEGDGLPYQEFSDRTWAAPELSRLEGLRQTAVERCAQARLDDRRPGDALALLESHTPAHPWREEGWRLHALALYRCGREADALEVLRTVRRRFTEELGLDLGPRLTNLASRILRRDTGLDLPEPSNLAATGTALSHSGTRAQLEASNAVLGSLAVAGDPGTARSHRLTAIRSAQELGDPELLARVVGGYDIPGIWTRSDDTQAAQAIINAAEHALHSGTGLSDRTRARLLATIAMESRGTASRRDEAAEAEAIARRLGDPFLLCFALSSRFMQEFTTTGLAGQRAALGAELTDAAHDADSPTFMINGHLIRMQALCALGDIEGANEEAAAVDLLAARHERRLATVFTGWYRHVFHAGPQPAMTNEMPGFSQGLAAFAALARQLRTGAPLSDGQFGPYEPWVHPLLLHRARRSAEAIQQLQNLPEPPKDLLQETIWCIIAQTAAETGEPTTAARAQAALTPARNERAAGGAIADLGLVSEYLQLLAQK